MNLTSRKLVNFVLNRFEIDISIFDDQYISKMIESSLDKFNIKTVDGLIDYLNANGNHFLEFYNLFLNGYSFFFREDLTYSILYSKVLPKLADNLKSDEELRIWSVGCSKGQEPYSIAILCEELKLKHDLDFNYRIIATDISKAALDKAEKGIYNISDMQNTKYKHLISYFNKVSDEYHIKKQIKKNVYFSEYNVVTSKSKYPPESIFGNFDIVICNNLMIYYNNEVKHDIVERLFSSVRVEGYFITSEAEIDYVTRITKEEKALCQSPVLQKTRK
jgi:chemotaxis methyl-accepting protein methylase